MDEIDSHRLMNPWSPELLGRGRFAAGKGNPSVVLKLVEAAIGDYISRIDAFHLRQSFIGHPRLYVAQVSDIVLNHIHKRSLTILLDRRRGNQGHSVQ